MAFNRSKRPRLGLGLGLGLGARDYLMRYLGLVSFRVGKLARYSWRLIGLKDQGRARARATYSSVRRIWNFTATFVHVTSCYLMR